MARDQDHSKTYVNAWYYKVFNSISNQNKVTDSFPYNHPHGASLPSTSKPTMRLRRPLFCSTKAPTPRPASERSIPNASSVCCITNESPKPRNAIFSLLAGYLVLGSPVSPTNLLSVTLPIVEAKGRNYISFYLPSCWGRCLWGWYGPSKFSRRRANWKSVLHWKWPNIYGRKSLHLPCWNAS